MSQPDAEGRIQANQPTRSATAFTSGKVPTAVARRSRRFSWVAATLILLALVAVGILVASAMTGVLDYAIVGFPTTPMTVEKAESIASAGPPAGSSLDEVESWLASQGVTSNSKAPGHYYVFSRRREDDTFPGWWMGCRGDQTVAECAGLKVGDVYSMVSIEYPDADRRLLVNDEITIFFFFDAKDRLIKHWVDKEYEGL